MMTHVKKRLPAVLGACNVVVSAVLALVWAWIPLGILSSGISGLAFLGTGVILLIAWLYLMEGAIWVERRRSQAVYGENISIPGARRSRREGFLGWLHGRWLLASSGNFWRGVLHHHLKMLWGATLALATGITLVLGSTALVGLLNPTLREEFTYFGLDVTSGALIPVLILSVIGLLLIIPMYWGAAYVDRALDRSLLGPTKASELAVEVTSLDRARGSAMDAATAERLRIERDLHDGVQPKLVALSMTIGMAKSKFDSDPEKSRELIEEAHGESKAVITDLRQLARGIHPAVLTDRGLDAALSAVAARSQVPVEVRVDVPRRLPQEVESIAYFTVSEALTNVNRHSGARQARITATLVPQPNGPEHLVVSVVDDGHGGARITRDGSSTGLAGLQDRATAARGTFTLTSPHGGPTTLVVELPCAS